MQTQPMVSIASVPSKELTARASSFGQSTLHLLTQTCAVERVPEVRSPLTVVDFPALVVELKTLGTFPDISVC